jgi:hypothetical protein
MAEGTLKWTAPDDAVVIAAVARAMRHQADVGELDTPVKADDIGAHLGVSDRSTIRNRLLPILNRLLRDKRLRVSGVGNNRRWIVTGLGAGIMRAEELPESPQHRDWRMALEWFTERIPALRHELRELAPKTDTLLGSDQASAVEWLAHFEQLGSLWLTMAVARYCVTRLEPDDARADPGVFRNPNGNAAPDWKKVWAQDRQRVAPQRNERKPAQSKVIEGS